MSRFKKSVEARWYGSPGWLWVFWPLSLLFRGVARLRRTSQSKHQKTLAVPVVVVGNITVGGTGKTPLLIALVRILTEAGFAPGVISRGYGGADEAAVQLVSPQSSSSDVGDEPLLIARAAQCPVAVSRHRADAAHFLVEQGGCNVILSDDGLQHYRLARDLEIAVVDATRAFGNGHCLPMGPLREPVSRLEEVDWVVRNGNHACTQLTPWSPVPMYLKPLHWCHVRTGETRPLEQSNWLDEPAYAVAGIGNPQRFFTTLTELGYTVYRKPFPDHHAYTAQDFIGFESSRVLMTAKDAVKCKDIAGDEWWYLEVAAELPENFRRAFIDRLQALVSSASA